MKINRRQVNLFYLNAVRNITIGIRENSLSLRTIKFRILLSALSRNATALAVNCCEKCKLRLAWMQSTFYTLLRHFNSRIINLFSPILKCHLEYKTKSLPRLLLTQIRKVHFLMPKVFHHLFTTKFCKRSQLEIRYEWTIPTYSLND